MTSVAARNNRPPTMDKTASSTRTMLASPSFRNDGAPPKRSSDPNNHTSPIASRSPDVRRRSYSPLSTAGEPTNPDNPETLPDPPSEGSSALSDIQDESDEDPSRSVSGSPTNNEDQESDSGNETEAETERLHISPQKARDQVLDEDQEDEDEEQEDAGQANDGNSNSQVKVKSGLRPQDILSDERGEDDASSDSDELAQENIAQQSPSTLAGLKRKRSGQLSPISDRSGSNGPSPRKRNSTKRSFGIQAPTMPTFTAGLEAAVQAVASSSEDEDDAAIRKIETAIRGSLTPPPEQEGSIIDEAQADAEAEAEEAAEADNEEDETEPTAKTEDDLIKKKQAYDQFKPLEKLFAIFRDRVFNETWAEFTTELELLNEPNTTHARFLAMRKAVDARKEEKQRLEQVTLQYKMKNLEKRILATRAQIHCQYYQKVRELRDSHLANLNSDYCQIQRERRQFIRKEPHYLYQFETSRPKQVENQTRYNKEVSLLSGIAKHKGFPGAPDLTSAKTNDVEEDFKAMRVHQAAPRAVSYHELAQSARASEAAGGDQFLADTPWANPSHPLNKRAPVMEAQNARIPIATPPPPAQPWMMSSALATSDTRPSGPSTQSDPRRPQANPDPLPNGSNYEGSSPLEHLKRPPTVPNLPTSSSFNENPTSWRDNAQAHLANRLGGTHGSNTPRVDKSPFETRATKTSANYPIDPKGNPADPKSYPIDPSAMHQSFATSALHAGGSERERSVTAGLVGMGRRAGAFGTPGVEREGSASAMRYAGAERRGSGMGSPEGLGVGVR